MLVISRPLQRLGKAHLIFLVAGLSLACNGGEPAPPGAARATAADGTSQPTTLTTSSGGSITDSAGNVWTLTSDGRVQENGSDVPGGSGTSQLTYVDSVIYGQDSASGNWYAFTDGQWQGPLSSPSGGNSGSSGGDTGSCFSNNCPAKAGTIFDDEFNTLDVGTVGDGQSWSYAISWSPSGVGYDGTSSWESNPTAPGMPPDANTYSVSHGVLRMGLKNTPADVPGDLVGNKPYIGSQITTAGTFQHLYGYYEARLQAQSGDCLSSAFWMIPADGSWPPEIDMPEFDTYDTSMAIWGVHDGPSDSLPKLFPAYGLPDVSAGMHVYAVDWRSDTITFYVDGTESAQTSTPADYGDKEMYLILDIMSSGPGSWNCKSGSVGDIDQAIYFDYVRVYASNPYLDGATNPDWNDHRTAY